jgi:hypothetical protein
LQSQLEVGAFFARTKTGERNLVDHLVFFAVKDDASAEDVEDLLSSIRNLRGSIPHVMDLSVGEDFSGRAKGYTHGLFVRLRTADDLRAYLDHPEHRAVVEKLDAHTSGRLVVDYDHEP